MKSPHTATSMITWPLNSTAVERVAPDASQVVAQIEALANVPAGLLRDLLMSTWQPGDALIARARIDALRNSYVSLGGAARRQKAKRPQQDVRLVVDELMRARLIRTKKRAFELVAKDRNLATDTIRNAYYAPQHLDQVITTDDRVTYKTAGLGDD